MSRVLPLCFAKPTLAAVLAAVLAGACCPHRETGLVLDARDTVAAGSLLEYRIRSPQNSNLVLELRWTDPAVNLDLHVTPPGCGPPPAFCSPGRIAASPAGTREATFVDGTAGREWVVYVVNAAGAATSFALEVRFETGICT